MRPSAVTAPRRWTLACRRGAPALLDFIPVSGDARRCHSFSQPLVSLHRFNKDGEPGRKVTCQECHQSKYGDTPPPDASKDADDVKTKPKKIRKLAPKFEHHMLLDHKKGLVSVFKTFPKYKFKGKGHEASDLRRLLGKYAEWAHILIPDMGFSDFVQKVEKGNNRRSQVNGIHTHPPASTRITACTTPPPSPPRPTTHHPRPPSPPPAGEGRADP